MSSIVKANPRLVGGRIELMSLIGEGGCASVYLGRHRETNNLVAAKLVHARKDQDALAMRFQREAELSAGLVHRNLVRVHDYFREDDGQPVLLMEYLRGQTVEEVLAAQGPIPVDATVAIVVAVLRGLHQAHELEIIHRDIKPSNIFLATEPDGVIIPKLLDFGIAKSKDVHAISLTQDGEVLGTPAYMSPEQVRGGDVGVGTDIFSVGAVLYEMLTGDLAFSAGTASAALAAVLERKVEPHERIPATLWPVIARALSKRASDRQQSVEELRWELEEAAAYGEASGQEAIQALHVVVPKLPLLPALTPAPFSPATAHLRLVQTAHTMSAPALDGHSITDETASITSSLELGKDIVKRRVAPWLVAAIATASVLTAAMMAWSRAPSAESPASATRSEAAAESPAPPMPQTAPQHVEIPAPAPETAPESQPSPVASAIASVRSAPPKAKPRAAVGRNPGF